MAIFNQVIAPAIYVYDIQTNQFLGRAKFDLTTEGEKMLLDLINNGAPVTSIPVVNLSFEPASGYIPPAEIETPIRNGVFRALFAMDKVGKTVPIEIQGTFSTKMRSNGFDTSLYASSAEFKDVQINSIHEVH